MEKFRRRVFTTIQIGTKNDFASHLFDWIMVSFILVNLFITIFETFDESAPYMDTLLTIEIFTIIFFTIEYILRVWTAKYLYPEKNSLQAALLFMVSFFGVIDLLTILPFYLPFFLPRGAVAFRVFRVIRILRLFRINTRYDAFNVIINVLNEKKSQIFSSISMILILMVSSSLCMYSLEHDAQPEQFQNAFSGIWWSMSTLLTVGYGDIYPITTLGKLMAIIIAFLGVGMVAIPTGIISAGFVEQYSKLKNIEFHSEERELKFVTSTIYSSHPWNNKMIKELVFPPQLLLVMIKRKKEVIVPKGDFKLKTDDILVIGAKNFKDEADIHLREVRVKEKNPWVGMQIRELDISRQELVVMIQRKNKVIIPNGSTIIMNGDAVHIYSKKDPFDDDMM